MNELMFKIQLTVSRSCYCILNLVTSVSNARLFLFQLVDHWTGSPSTSSHDGADRVRHPLIYLLRALAVRKGSTCHAR